MKKFLFLVIIAGTGLRSWSQCAQVLDQQLTPFNNGTWGGTQWQSFTAGVTGKLTQIDLYKNGCETYSFNLNIYSGTGTGGALLYTNTYSWNTCSVWINNTIPFGTAPILTAGFIYTYELVMISSSSGSPLGFLSHDGNLYAGGTYYSSAYGSQPSWDMDFRTYITPTNAPSISITGQANPSCFGLSDGSITTITSGGNGGNTYLWTPSGQTTANASGLSANSYTVVVTDVLGCTGSANATLVNPPLVTMTDPADQVVCAGGLTSAVNFVGATSYAWTNSNTTIGLAATGAGNIPAFTAINSGAGPQVATITVTPISGGCTGTPQTFTITVNPTPTVTDPPNQAQCNGFNTAAIVFSGSVGGTVFNWTNTQPSIGLAASGTGNISSFTAINSGTSPVTAIGVVTPVANGCSGPTQDFSITVYPTPTVNDPPDQVVCNGTSTAAVVFTSTVGGTSFGWTNSTTSIGLPLSGSGNITSFTATNPGASPVTSNITVTPNAAGCNGPAQNFTITVNPTPAVVVPADQVLCNGSATSAVNFTGTVAGTTYSWVNDNPSIGLSGSGSGTIATFTALNGGTAPAIANVMVTPQANGCVGTSQTFTFTVNPIPNVIDAFNQTHCAGDLTSAVTWTGGVTGTVFNWTNSNTSIGLPATGSGDILSFTATNPGVTPITGTIVVTPAANGCIGSSENFTITVNPSPNVYFFPAFPDLCVNDPIYVFNEGSPVGAGGVYTGTGVSANAIDPLVAGPGVHTITYTFTDGNGCVDFAGQNITIYAAPVVTFSAVPDFCEDGSTYLLVEGSPAGGTYAGPGISAGVFDPVSAAPGTHAVAYTYTDGNGCANVANQTIIVNALPIVTFSATPAFCANTAAYTLVEGTPAGGSYSGPGVAGGIFDPATAGPGGHTINYSYTDGNGCSDNADQVITVNSVPVVSFSPLADVCENATVVTLTEGSPAGGIYSGPGVTDPDFNPAVAGVGTASLTYTFTDINGCSDFADQLITVLAIPTVTASADATICAGDNSPVSVTGTAASYSWDNGLGAGASHVVAPPSTTTYTVTGTATNTCTASDVVVVNVNSLPIVNLAPLSDICLNATPFALSGGTPAGGVYSGPGVSGGNFDPMSAGTGNHLITYTFTDGNGCINQASANQFVYSAPAVTANATATNLCDGSSLTLTGGGAATYSWDNGATDGVAFVPAVGTITYTVTGIDINGCQNTDQVAVTVHPLPAVSAGADQTICEGTSLSLTGSGANSYAWNNGVIDGVSFTPSAGTLTYSVIGTDLNGCENNDDVVITVNPLPALVVSPDEIFCAGETITLTAGGATTFDWNSGAGTSSSFSITPGSTTIVTVSGTAMGCTATENITLTLDDPAVIDAGPDVTICSGFSTYLVATGAVSYVWNGPGTINIPGDTYGFIVDSSAWYYVTATTANSCIYTDSVYVTAGIDPSCTIEPLTSFSPNGDAVNDVWKIQGITAFPENTVTIINRWGDVVFEGSNYDNETIMWGGTLPNGSEAPEGTYFYVIELTDGPSTTGWIQLLK
jgi:gliding motility-associated-like protein